MAANVFTYFSLLMWKNFLIKFRHKKELLIEILVPIAFSCILLAIRGIAYPEIIAKSTLYEPNPLFNLSNFQGYTINQVGKWEIDFTPKHPKIDELMKFAVDSLVSSPKPEIRGFDTAIELQRFMMTNDSLAGVIFDVDTAELDRGWPKDFKFSLRFPGGLRTAKRFGITTTWLTKNKFPLFLSQGPRNPDRNDGGTPPGYIPEGFATIQNVISWAYLKLSAGDNRDTKIPVVQVQRFPFKPYIDDPVLKAMEVMVSFILLLSFVYPCIQAVKHVTTEKESQLKEAMKIMGLSTALHWSAWFFTLWICLFATVILIVVILRVPWFDDWTLGAFSHTSASLLLVFFAIYAIGMVTFSFMVSAFFSKANVAGAVTGLIWFAFYIPYSFTLNNFVDMSLGSKLGFSVFLNTAMSFGFKIIINWEGLGIGSQWENLFKTVTIEENMSLGHIMLIMIFDAIIYMAVALYVEKIMPGSYGRVYKWYFPVTPSFWFPKKGKYVGLDNASAKDPERFEPEITSSEAGIRLINLSKAFGPGKLAVDGINVNMYNNQITVLLGHNGAGKTTSISMITGLISPTSGTAIVNNFDILENMAQVRKSFGFCPQHNILFDELTVREHIIFYSRLKGLNMDEINEEIDKYVKILDFEDKRNAQAKTLSGGMKRKLSVGVALCGRSKVVICDEPSSGMDPAARRALWDLILLEKKDRTILLTTHFMDEADVLGDRIAIMSQGKLQCSGTPFFLKKRFGTGYRLICSKRQYCKVEHVTDLIRKYIPDVVVKSDVGTELSYDLPEKYVYLFEELLKDLEESQEDLQLNGYGISMTTLEDVFMKTGSELSEDLSNHKESNNGSIESVNGYRDSVIFVDPKTDTIELVGSGKRMEYQWRAMFLKKIYNFKRNWYIFLIQLLIPLILTIISIYVPTSGDTSKDLPELPISLNIYGSTVTLLEKAENTKIAESFENMFKGIGTDKRLSVINQTMSDEIIKLQIEDLLRVNTRYMAGVTITTDTIVAWFNNEALHSVPIALNLAHNAIAKAILGSDHSIQVTNDPLPFSIDIKLESVDFASNLGFQLAQNITFAMSFVSGIFVMFMIRERVSRAKLLQFVSGVRVLTFWLVHFIWDFIVFAIISACLVLLLWIYSEEGFATSSELGRLYLTLLVYAFASLPLTYLVSLVYDDAPTGMSRLVMLHIFTGNALYILALMLTSPIINLDSNAGDIMKRVGLIFPSFTLAQGLGNQATIGTTEGICKQLQELAQLPMQTICATVFPDCCELQPFAWTDPGMARVLTAMTVVGFVLFLFLQIVENRAFFLSKLYLPKSTRLPPVSEEGHVDDDVQRERDQISKLSIDEIAEHNLVMRDVTKFYKRLVAVNQLSVRIDRGECFGLLGINGAGKTSTFKMLTGDETISHGDIWVRGYNIESARSTVYEMIGYCPQFDGLLMDLTGAETLRMFSLLRGIPSYMIDALIKRLARELAFEKHLNKKVLEYSGGNRRKLSTAVAILGNPHVVYLDEPTTGIDPGSRRKLWDMVCHVRDIGKAIVLTSHSMEECEALCTRIAIMVNGEFKCLGSTQHLKNKFAQGISLTIKMQVDFNEYQPGHNRTPSTDLSRPDSVLNLNRRLVIQFISDHFQGAVLKESHRNYLTFDIPTNVMPYSRIFGLMEANKDKLHIEDYSLSQATLEQIFLNFAQKQRSEEENKALRRRRK